MARSFFERLTGSVRINEGESPAPALERKVSPGRSARIKQRTGVPGEQASTFHPVSADSQPTPDQMLEDESAEEGQLTVDIFDDGSHIVIQSTVAGVKPEDIDISLQDETLTIRGSRRRTQEVSEDNFYYKELYWGTFSRSIILPEEVDFQKADAVIKNGLLTIKLPKKDRGERKITVKAA